MFAISGRKRTLRGERFSASNVANARRCPFSRLRDSFPRGDAIHPLLIRQLPGEDAACWRAVPLGESGPRGRKGKLQAVALVKDERRIEYTDGSDFQRATWLMRGVAPSVACAPASPEGTPYIRC